MESVAMGRLYSFGRQDSKMSVPVHTPPSPPEIKYENDISLGPYYAQYWNLVGGTVEHDGMPIPANGSYISPYGSAPESFFPTIQDPELPTGLEEVPWNGVSACGDPLFTHSRSTSYGPVADAAHPYNTPPMDGCAWPQYPSSSDPIMQMQSLPALENLANQILATLVSGSAQDFVNTVASPDDEGSGQAYATVEALFEQQKRIFSRGRLFLDAAGPSTSPAYPRVARKVNLATFVTCVFRGQDVPFLELDEAFLDIFMPTGSRLLKGEGALYLELKTQAFIALVMNGAAARDDVLDKLFPRDLQLAILRRRPEPTHLAPSEADFISRVNTRRQYLNAGAQSVESLAQLPQKYIWKDFLDEVASCVKRVLEGLDSGKDRHAALMGEDPITKATLAAHAAISAHHHPHHPHHAHHRSISLNSLGGSATSAPFHPGPMLSFADSPSSLASGRSFRSGTGSTGSPTSPSNGHHHQQSIIPLPYPRATSHPSAAGGSGKPTSMSNGRRPNAPSPRRPWTQDEEKALLDGLERVKGPHWSQILALYGAGGSVSEVLKDRNQVQLKDKARNLKLFFLKSGVEVPGYLKRVTGELRTRAPGQAARRERERRREEEERLRREREAVGV